MRHYLELSEALKTITGDTGKKDSFDEEEFKQICRDDKAIETALNLIKMNLYRLFKTRVFYVMLLTTVILTGLLAGMETESASTFGEFYASFASSGYVLIMVGVFAIVFSEEERKSGFLKNLLTSAQSH